jgi:hypothetical protein
VKLEYDFRSRRRARRKREGTGTIGPMVHGMIGPTSIG